VQFRPFLSKKGGIVACLVWVCLLTHLASAQDRLRQPLEDGVSALLQYGQTITLEITLSSSSQAQAIISPYLAAPSGWRSFVRGSAALIPFERLSAMKQRHVLLTLFPLDYVDHEGWHHHVRIASDKSPETVKILSYWLTGSQDNAALILSVDANRAVKEPLQRGQIILFPQPFLRPVMKEPCASFASRNTDQFAQPFQQQTSPKPKEPPSATYHERLPLMPQAAPPQTPEPTAESAESAMAENYHKDLEYGEDKEGRYAIYRLKPGESLYSAVIVRFTDYTANADVLQACEIVAKRTGIKNMHHVTVEQKVKIPADLLSDQYQPLGTVQRENYETIREEARRLQEIRKGTRNLQGVILVLDPGHGGIDPGAIRESDGLYEDEINYDIACRIKEILEKATQARVFMTLEDPSQGFKPTNNKRFVHDKDERILTTPRYTIANKDIANNLRWYLANSIYSQARKNGADPQKIVFASIHCDYIYDETVRGTMIYVPGVAHRKNEESHTSGIYAQFEEVRQNPVASSTHSQRVQDEALSRSLSASIIRAMRTHNPPLKVHSIGNPVRSEIRKSGGKSYLPTVLRNTAIPTKVLVEVANMNNPQDRQHLANPEWRQWFAESFVDALISHYNK